MIVGIYNMSVKDINYSCQSLNWVIDFNNAKYIKKYKQRIKIGSMAFYKMMGWCLSEDEKKRTEPISTDEK